MGLSEWTITANTNPLYNNSAVAFSVLDSGVVIDGFSDVSNHYYAIRPCFYLNSDVIYISGTGTQSDPFRIQ